MLTVKQIKKALDEMYKSWIILGTVTLSMIFLSRLNVIYKMLFRVVNKILDAGLQIT
jgi:hypothetical protein